MHIKCIINLTRTKKPQAALGMHMYTHVLMCVQHTHSLSPFPLFSTLQ